MRAIILVFDQIDTKIEAVKVENDCLERIIFDFILDRMPKFIFRLIPFLKNRDWYQFKTENQLGRCFCGKNNSVDRAKILIKYLRTKLQFIKEGQIIFLRTSKFLASEQIIENLKEIIRQYPNEDLVFYYSGHGITPVCAGWFSENPIFLFKIIKWVLEILFDDRPGWSIGDFNSIHVYYDQLQGVFELLKGKLIFITDCCHSLAIEPYLKQSRVQYLLFGPSRIDSVSRISILDGILGSWRDRFPANPQVYAVSVGGSDGYDIDFPMYCIRGSYYNCNCGTAIKSLKIFQPNERPSLRRGSDLDYLMYLP